MVKKAKMHGLSFRSDVDLDGNSLSAQIADSYKSFGSGVYALISPPLYRTIGREPELRDNGTHTNVNEEIDNSMFDRWRADTAYRPKNLIEWAQRKRIHPVRLESSVRADDPEVMVAD